MRTRCSATKERAVAALEKDQAAERQAWEREMSAEIAAEEARVRKAVAAVWPAMRAEIEEKEEVRVTAVDACHVRCRPVRLPRTRPSHSLARCITS